MARDLYTFVFREGPLMSPTQKWQSPCHTPKILERSLATRQKTLKEAKQPEYLTCGQGSFKDLWGLARDLYHFCPL